MQIIQEHDFIEELSEILICIFYNLDTTYTFGTPLPDARAVFLPECLLPLFLYDKQKYINRFCKEHFSKDTFFQLKYHFLPREKAAMCVDVYPKHNLLYEKDYLLLYKFIVTLITVEISKLLTKQNHLEITPLYMTCMENFLSEFHAKHQ
jgi:hypothetical protein